MSSLEDIAHWKTRIAVGRMAFDAGFYFQAAKHFRTALESLKETDTSQTQELLSINLVCLAKALSCLGNYVEAEQLVNQALQTDTANQENISQLALDYLELSSISLKQHRSEQCQMYANKALDLLQNLSIKEKENHAPAIARALKLLAINASNHNNYDEGLKLIDKSLNLLEHTYGGTKSEAYGEALLAKVMLLVDKGKFEEIGSMLEDAIQIIELHKGQFHPQLGKVISILSEHTKRLGKEELSEELKKQAQKIKEKSSQ